MKADLFSIKKLFVMLGFSMFLVIASGLLIRIPAMETRQGCPFSMDTDSMCANHGVEHAGHWLQFLSLSKPSSVIYSLLLLCLAFFFAIKLFGAEYFALQTIPGVSVRSIDPPDLVTELFSRGILNPKRY